MAEELTDEKLRPVIANYENIIKHKDARIKELEEKLSLYEWKDAKTIPSIELECFLILCRNIHEGDEPFVLEVSWFEGQLYPTCLCGNINYDDRFPLEQIIGWCSSPPTKEGDKE